MASKQPKNKGPSTLETKFASNWKSISDIEFEEQVDCQRVISFASDNAPEWCFDFVFWDYKTVVEINGGTHRGRKGGHSSGPGIKKGYLKSICVQSQGWLFFELDSEMTRDIEMIHLIHDIMTGRGAGREIHPDPKNMLCFGNNRRAQNRLIAAESTVANWVQSQDKRPNPGDFCFLATMAMKTLSPYKKGRSKLVITQVREAMDSLGFRKALHNMGESRRTAYFHTAESVKLYD